MKRYWGVRHVRYWWQRRRVYLYAEWCRHHGLGLGTPNPADLAHLDRIWRGEA